MNSMQNLSAACGVHVHVNVHVHVHGMCMCVCAEVKGGLRVAVEADCPLVARPVLEAYMSETIAGWPTSLKMCLPIGRGWPRL